MENFVPRLVGKSEASRLGIQDGWYGTKVSGTFVTERYESLAMCIDAIDLIPVSLEVEYVDPPAKPRLATPFHSVTSLLARAAYRQNR
jgi:hypothetical protein